MANQTDNADPFQGTSGLTQWLIWLAILLGVSAVIFTAFLLSRDDAYGGLINWAMYAMIAALGLGLIVKCFADARFLQRQTNIAASQMRLLERVDNIDDFLSGSQPSIFRTHIENLYTIAQSHIEISQDNLIELLHTRLVARNRVVELFSSILITLGLIGTILGLILMMDELTLVMQNADSDQLMAQLVGADGPLSGLGVAFVTTLLGAVLGGVILRVLSSVVESNITQYTAHIAELTEVYVLPFLRSAAARGFGEASEKT